MRIILLEVSHWHVSLYLDALASEDVEVVAVSDRDTDRASGVAGRFAARVYADWRHMLAAERADFAFAFGRHCEMAAIGTELTARGIPFALEKPCGLNAADVRRIVTQARGRNLFVAVPLVQQFGPLGELLAEVRRPAEPSHAWFRFIAGPPSRYPAAGCDWMLDPQQSGGGCFINLAGHFVHLALRVMAGVSRVSARMSSAIYRERVEDYALVTLEAPDGGTAVVETGYLFPSGVGRPREVYYSLFNRNGCRVWWDERAGKAISGQPWSAAEVDLDSDPLYARFIRETLAAFRRGGRPPVGLESMIPVMDVIDAAYASARCGRPVVVNIDGAEPRET